MNFILSIEDWKKILTSTQIAHIEEMIPTNQGKISSNEIFNALLEYEGIIGYDNWIKARIEEIYWLTVDAEDVDTELIELED